MRTKWTLLLAGLLLLGGVGLVAAQETVPNQGTYYPNPSNQRFDGNVWIKGTLYRGTAQADWIQFFPGNHSCYASTPSATLIPTRMAAADWALGRVATAAETYNVSCAFSVPSRSTTSAGAKITNVTLVYGITTADLTSNTWNGLKTATYASGALNAIANYGTISAPTLSTVARATPYETSIDVTSPAYLNSAGQVVVVDFTPVMATTGGFYLYGAKVTFTRAD